DLKSFKDSNDDLVYTVFSNGDSTNPESSAFQFKVEKRGEETVFKIRKKFNADASIREIGGGGNYDVELNGNYLINYGLFKADTLKNRLLFEYRNENDKILAQYTVPPQ